jgi:ketosteroid isomerase-like protein
MSHTDLIRGNYARVTQPGGIESVVATLHPEHELVDVSVGGESPVIFRGHDGFRKWAAVGLRSFEGTTFAPSALEEHGDTVLVTIEVTAVGVSSGAPLDLRIHHVIEMREGLVWRTAGYLDEASARAAAGAGFE